MTVARRDRCRLPGSGRVPQLMAGLLTIIESGRCNGLPICQCRLREGAGVRYRVAVGAGTRPGECCENE